MEYFIKKNTGVLSEIISGNIEKERLKSKELDKGNKWELGALKDPTTTV